MTASPNLVTAAHPFVLRVHGPDVNRDFPLREGRTHVGRLLNAEIVINDPLLSHLHARFVRHDDRCSVEDLNSGNGVKVNGIRLVPDQPFPLAPGDQVVLGQHVIELVAPRNETSPATSPKAAFDEPAAMQAEAAESQTADADNGADQAPQAAELHVAPEPAPAASALPPITRPPASPPAPVGEPIETLLPLTSIRLIQHLPELYNQDGADDSFLARYLAIFESIYLPLEWTVVNFELWLDLRTAPDPFLSWWDRWFGLQADGLAQGGWQLPSSRSLLAEAFTLLGRRGTRVGLQRALELYTGHTPEIIDEAVDLSPCTFRVRAVLGSGATAAGVAAIIEAFKPAHTVCQLSCEALP